MWTQESIPLLKFLVKHLLNQCVLVLCKLHQSIKLSHHPRSGVTGRGQVVTREWAGAGYKPLCPGESATGDICTELASGGSPNIGHTAYKYQRAHSVQVRRCTNKSVTKPLLRSNLGVSFQFYNVQSK